ncbi:MAG: hypothetical protein WC565_08640 [Parcubacteria group bacterium]|jgi:uncharacterized protein (DUF983 family)
MAFTKEQEEKLSKWIESKGIRTTCPACGRDVRRSMHNSFVSIMEAKMIGTELASSASRMPLVMLVCNNCRHVQLFEASETLTLM